ncbi:MAG: trehalose-phosphatase [Candidatus Omnitrophica bacterium]|nr:trehalose-phosphatase [Candidatus Omnitrophota bacterium]
MGKYLFDSVIFDLDGIITKTAIVHAQAWKRAFDEYLQLRRQRDGEPFKEFTHEGDYLPFVDGKPRYEGVDSFLKSRDISIPFGDASDSPDQETVCGLGNKKNVKFRDYLDNDGVEVYSSTIELVKKLKTEEIKVGVASSSKNCKVILQSAGIEDLFETRVDGMVSAEIGLKGKPEGDIFVKAASNLDAAVSLSVVVEDAVSGVLAGRNGGFGMVIGVAREGNRDELLKNGADLVVEDLSEIDIDYINNWFLRRPRPLFDSWEKEIEQDSRLNPIFARCAKSVFFGLKKPVLFLDYDGTLTPIVDRPEWAVISDEMRNTIKELASKFTVAIVSGRMREDVENLLGIDGLFYAGSHGFDINGPGFSMIEPRVKELIPLVDKMIAELKKELGDIQGVIIEEKKLSTAVHYRLVDEEKYLTRIKDFVDKVVSQNSKFRLLCGKKVFEILPNIDWDKGKAVRWIMQAFNLSWSEASVIYIGDDTTDEYAFRVVRTRGTAILVSKEGKESSADFGMSTPDDTKKLFEMIIAEAK